MRTATVNFKTDEITKRKAQDISGRLGIPLSSLLNAYLYELVATGSVHFTVSEPMTEKMENMIAQAEKEIAAGEVSGSFENPEDMFAHLDGLK